MKRYMKLTVLVIMLVPLFATPAPAEDGGTGFSGTLLFHQGEAVAFDHLGNRDKLYTYTLYGIMGAQRVSFPLSDLSEVIFGERDKDYGNSERGEIIVVNAQGKRFTIREASISTKRAGQAGTPVCTLYYVYQDPVTEKLKETYAIPGKDVAAIKIGDHAGNIKKNPKTGEYFPSMFLFDPYTGHRLIWEKQP